MPSYLPSALSAKTPVPDYKVWWNCVISISFAGRGSTHGMDQDRSNAGLLEPSLETPQNGFGSFEVIRISL